MTDAIESIQHLPNRQIAIVHRAAHLPATRLVLQPGNWELGCFEPGHHEAGMHRRLVVDP